jgi:hypothetical protein
MTELTLTRAEVAALTTEEALRYYGRELDVEVARDVLGCRVETIKPSWYPYEVVLFFRADSPMIEYAWDINSCNALMHRNGVDDKDGTAPVLPSFSEEWEHAGIVIRHMANIGRPLHVEGELTPRAVCLAALRAVRVADGRAQGNKMTEANP